MAQVELEGLFAFELPEGWEATALEDQPGFRVETGQPDHALTVTALPAMSIPPEEVLEQVVSRLIGAEVLREEPGERDDGLPTAEMLLRLDGNLHWAHVVTGPGASAVVHAVHPEADEELAEPLAALIESLAFEEDDTYLAQVVLAALEVHHPQLSFKVPGPDRIEVTGKDGTRELDLSDLARKVSEDPESEGDLIADYLETDPLG